MEAINYPYYSNPKTIKNVLVILFCTLTKHCFLKLIREMFKLCLDKQRAEICLTTWRECSHHLRHTILYKYK